LKDGWNFKLTPELQSSIDAFTEWYATQHRNRQLSWRPQLGTVTLTARFESGKYEIGVSLFQAIVLLHFNDDNSLDVKELQARTGIGELSQLVLSDQADGIEQKELVRVLQSLSMGRKGTRVLVKKPPGKVVAPTDLFLWNKAFNSDRIKFRINQIQQDLSAEESKKTNEQVAIDRVSVLEATIVRIMKGRKTLTLQLLIDAVISDVSKRFPPDVKEMKKRVESLIEREVCLLVLEISKRKLTV
jgi:cullin-4